MTNEDFEKFIENLNSISYENHFLEDLESIEIKCEESFGEKNNNSNQKILSFKSKQYVGRFDCGDFIENSDDEISHDKNNLKESFRSALESKFISKEDFELSKNYFLKLYDLIREDGETSKSIGNQKNILKEYCNSENFKSMFDSESSHALCIKLLFPEGASNQSAASSFIRSNFTTLNKINFFSKTFNDMILSGENYFAEAIGKNLYEINIEKSYFVQSAENAYKTFKSLKINDSQDLEEIIKYYGFSGSKEFSEKISLFINKFSKISSGDKVHARYDGDIVDDDSSISKIMSPYSVFRSTIETWKEYSSIHMRINKEGLDESLNLLNGRGYISFKINGDDLSSDSKIINKGLDVFTSVLSEHAGDKASIKEVDLKNLISKILCLGIINSWRDEAVITRSGSSFLVNNTNESAENLIKYIFLNSGNVFYKKISNLFQEIASNKCSKIFEQLELRIPKAYSFFWDDLFKENKCASIILALSQIKSYEIRRLNRIESITEDEYKSIFDQKDKCIEDLPKNLGSIFLINFEGYLFKKLKKISKESIEHTLDLTNEVNYYSNILFQSIDNFSEEDLASFLSCSKVVSESGSMVDQQDITPYSKQIKDGLSGYKGRSLLKIIDAVNLSIDSSIEAIINFELGRSLGSDIHMINNMNNKLSIIEGFGNSTEYYLEAANFFKENQDDFGIIAENIIYENKKSSDLFKKSILLNRTIQYGTNGFRAISKVQNEGMHKAEDYSGFSKNKFNINKKNELFRKIIGAEGFDGNLTSLAIQSITASESLHYITDMSLNDGIKIFSIQFIGKTLQALISSNVKEDFDINKEIADKILSDIKSNLSAMSKNIINDLNNIINDAGENYKDEEDISFVRKIVNIFNNLNSEEYGEYENIKIAFISDKILDQLELTFQMINDKNIKLDKDMLKNILRKISNGKIDFEEYNDCYYIFEAIEFEEIEGYAPCGNINSNIIGITNEFNEINRKKDLVRIFNPSKEVKLPILKSEMLDILQNEERGRDVQARGLNLSNLNKSKIFINSFIIKEEADIKNKFICTEVNYFLQNLNNDAFRRSIYDKVEVFNKSASDLLKSFLMAEETFLSKSESKLSNLFKEKEYASLCLSTFSYNEALASPFTSSDILSFIKSLKRMDILYIFFILSKNEYSNPKSLANLIKKLTTNSDLDFNNLIENIDIDSDDNSINRKFEFKIMIDFLSKVSGTKSQKISKAINFFNIIHSNSNFSFKSKIEHTLMGGEYSDTLFKPEYKNEDCVYPDRDLDSFFSGGLLDKMNLNFICEVTKIYFKIHQTFHSTLIYGAIPSNDRFESFLAEVSKLSDEKDFFNEKGKFRDINLFIKSLNINMENLSSDENISAMRIIRKIGVGLELISDSNSKNFYHMIQEKKKPQLFSFNFSFQIYEDEIKPLTYTFETLQDLDPYHFSVGADTNCCQVLGGAGNNAAIDSFINEYAGVLVLKDDNGLISQSYFHWLEEENYLILDNIEIAKKADEQLYAILADYCISRNFFKKVLCGKSYTKINIGKFSTNSEDHSERVFRYSEYTDYNNLDSIDLGKPNFSLKKYKVVNSSETNSFEKVDDDIGLNEMINQFSENFSRSKKIETDSYINRKDIQEKIYNLEKNNEKLKEGNLESNEGLELAIKYGFSKEKLISFLIEENNKKIKKMNRELSLSMEASETFLYIKQLIDLASKEESPLLFLEKIYNNILDIKNQDIMTKDKLNKEVDKIYALIDSKFGEALLGEGIDIKSVIDKKTFDHVLDIFHEISSKNRDIARWYYGDFIILFRKNIKNLYDIKNKIEEIDVSIEICNRELLQLESIIKKSNVFYNNKIIKLSRFLLYSGIKEAFIESAQLKY